MELLYISYDGMLEPLGQSQVLSYLFPIADVHRVTLLSYEKSHDLRDHSRRRVMAEALRTRGIRWLRLRYHKRPSLLATGYDVLAGILVGAIACRRRGVRTVHARGYVASVIALVLKRLCGAAFVFDMRGFWPDEKVDAGHWSRTSLTYRLAKRWERRFFEQADAIICLSRAGVRRFGSLGYDLSPATPIEVIPTCTDLTRFAPGPRDPALVERWALQGRTVIGCIGTLSNWYLRESTLRYLALLASRIERSAVLCVTREDHARLRTDALAAGVPAERLIVTQAEFADMPAFLRLMDVGVFLIKPAFSKAASAATKLGEFLATGVPVVINDGIGDSGELVRAHRVGVVLPEVTEEAFVASLSRVQELLRDPSCRARCRDVAQQHFDLATGVQRYLQLYRAALSNSLPAAGGELFGERHVGIPT